jgi:pimeloyl-ACP methyl ester carboxylesterase
MRLWHRNAPRTLRFMAMALEAAGQISDAWRPARRDDFGTGQGRPVLLLHGFGAPRRILSVLERRLRRNLGVAVISFHLPGLGGALGGGAIEAEAGHLAAKLERVCQRHHVTELDIIGHSKGGLVAHYMVSHFPIGARVRTLVALGTPFAGAPLALLAALAVGMLSRSVWQLIPASRFLRDLRKAPLPNGLRVVSVAGALDLVAPSPLCRLPVHDAAPGMFHNYVVSGVGHNSLLMSRRVFAIIASELGRPEALAGGGGLHATGGAQRG